MPADYGCRAVNLLALSGMIFHVLFNLLASQTVRVKPATWRHGRRSNKRLEVIEQIEARAVDPQITAQFDVPGILASFKRQIELQAIRIGLPPVDVVEIA